MVHRVLLDADLAANLLRREDIELKAVVGVGAA
jgi:hypothetical protein